MVHDEIDQILKKIVPILEEAGVVKSSVFGSVARGVLKERSDVDLLIEYPEGKNLFDLAELQNELEKAIDREVDLLTYNSISEHLKSIIEDEKIDIL